MSKQNRKSRGSAVVLLLACVAAAPAPPETRLVGTVCDLSERIVRDLTAWRVGPDSVCTLSLEMSSQGDRAGHPPGSQHLVWRRFAAGSSVGSRESGVPFVATRARLARTDDGKLYVLLQPRSAHSQQDGTPLTVYEIDQELEFQHVVDLPASFELAYRDGFLSLASRGSGWVAAFGQMRRGDRGVPAFVAWRSRSGRETPELVVGRLRNSGWFSGGKVHGATIYAFGMEESAEPIAPASDRHLGDDNSLLPTVAAFSLADGTLRWRATVGGGRSQVRALDVREHDRCVIAAELHRIQSTPRLQVIEVQGGSVRSTFELEDVRGNAYGVVARADGGLDLLFMAEFCSLQSPRQGTFPSVLSAAFLSRHEGSADHAGVPRLLCESFQPYNTGLPRFVGGTSGETFLAVLEYAPEFDRQHLVQLFAVE